MKDLLILIHHKGTAFGMVVLYHHLILLVCSFCRFLVQLKKNHMNNVCFNMSINLVEILIVLPRNNSKQPHHVNDLNLEFDKEGLILGLKPREILIKSAPTQTAVKLRNKILSIAANNNKKWRIELEPPPSFQRLFGKIREQAKQTLWPQEGELGSI